MLFCFSSNHRTAEFGFLEELERHASAVNTNLADYSDAVNGWVVLATCNRFEAYLDIDDPLPSARAVAPEIIIDTLHRSTGLDPDALRTAGSFYFDHDVAQHLFAVSSGLESVVIGEEEIGAQVRRALGSARENGTLTSELNRLFQGASRTARGVKKRTGIVTAGRSLVRLSLELAESCINDWSAVSVLVIGTGKYAGATLAALREKGATDIAVYSSSGRAEAFALSHNTRAVAQRDFEHALAESQLIISCSAVVDYMLTPHHMQTAQTRSGALESHLIIDLGLPRNVDPAVVNVLGVDLLDLETISLHAPLADRTAAVEARTIVGAAAAEFAAQSAEQAVTPALVALRTHVLGVLESEIERARARGAASAETEAALRHLTGVLLHTPSVRARELVREGSADAFINGVTAVFGIDVQRHSSMKTTSLRDAPNSAEAS